MASTEQEVSQAIDESKQYSTIARVSYSPTAIRLLKKECEDWVEGNANYEFWGKDIEGCEWRVHVPCPVPKSHVVVEVMPVHLASSHRAAGNWGTYPHNGAERYATDVDTAEALTDDASYAHEVSDHPADYEFKSDFSGYC